MKFLVYALAVWRVTSLIVSEDGPWQMFRRLRKWAGVYSVGEMSETAILFSCFWCASVWVAGLLFFAPPRLRVVLGASAAAILADRVRERVDVREKVEVPAI